MTNEKKHEENIKQISNLMDSMTYSQITEVLYLCVEKQLDVMLKQGEDRIAKLGDL